MLRLLDVLNDTLAEMVALRIMSVMSTNGKFHMRPSNKRLRRVLSLQLCCKEFHHLFSSPRVLLVMLRNIPAKASGLNWLLRNMCSLAVLGFQKYEAQIHPDWVINEGNSLLVALQLVGASEASTADEQARVLKKHGLLIDHLLSMPSTISAETIGMCFRLPAQFVFLCYFLQHLEPRLLNAKPRSKRPRVGLSTALLEQHARQIIDAAMKLNDSVI